MKPFFLAKLLLFSALAMLTFGSAVFGQVVISQFDTPSTQNFDGIGNAPTATLPSGWKITSTGNPNVTNYAAAQTQTTLAAGTTGTGSLNGSSSGAAYNFANGVQATSTDRAIGFLASTSYPAPRNIFVQIQNNTNETIASFDVSFIYEKYRNGGRGTNMNFYASTNGVDWVAVPAGNETFPADTPSTNTTVQNPPVQVTKSFNLPGAGVPAGQVFYLRWEYAELSGGSGGRQAVGLDDVSITARRPGTNPSLTVSTSSLGNFGNTSVGSTSPEREYTVSGTNLTDGILVTAPADFLVSTTEGGPYTSSVTIPQSGGTVPTTSVYVVMAPSSTGPKSGVIANNSTGATVQNVSVSGTGVQSFTVNGQALYKGGQPLAGIQVNALQNGTVAGSALTDANGNYALNLPAGGNYGISVESAPFAFAPPVQAVNNLSGNQTINFNALGSTVLISEFRFHGGNGGTDEFIELYNNSNLPVDISGFALVSADSPTPKFVVPGSPYSRTTLIPARGHYLIVGPGYSLGAYAAGDNGLAADIPDGSGIGLFLNSNNIAPNSRIDATGFAGVNAPFSEGNPINPAGGVNVNAEVSFIRNFGNEGYPADTDNNAADFVFVSTTAGNFGGVQSVLGAPGPENRQSPIFNATGVTGALLDAAVSGNAAPNRVTDPSATNGGLTPRGTAGYRRTYTNVSGSQITRFRLRIVGLSTIGSPQQYTPQSVLRVMNSADVTVTKSDGSSVLVRGTTLETPPNQPQFGGFNSSLIVNLAQPLNPGDSINVDTTLGIVESGRLIFNTAVETLLAAPPSTSEHLVMGNPSNAVADVNMPFNYLLDKAQYAVSYHRDRAIPNWVSWHLDSTWIGSSGRTDAFAEDPTLPAGWYRVQSNSYSGSGFDRGHHAPSADRTRSRPDNEATFLMTNMMPQAPDNNQGPWEALESYSRTLVGAGNELYIIAGGYGTGGTGSGGGVTNSVDNGRVAVPNVTFKVIIVIPVGDNDVARVNANTRVIAVIMPNTQGIRNNDWRNYRVSVDQVEQLTGLDFFSNVPVQIQSVIESRVDNQ